MLRQEPQDGFDFTPSAEDWAEFHEWCESIHDDLVGEAMDEANLELLAVSRDEELRYDESLFLV